MTIPSTIHISQITLGERGRSEYSGIDQLAESIEGHGLIQPIVLVLLDNERGLGPFVVDTPMFGLDAGGRRFHALKLLFDSNRWDGTLAHASTSEPGRPGFVIKGEDQSTPLKRLMTELAENFDRLDPDWRDQVKMLSKAWKMARADADSKSETLLMRDFGFVCGCGYANLQAAVIVHDDVIANPEFYKDCTGIRQAYGKLLKKNATELTKLLAAKSIATSPLSTNIALSSSVSIQSEPRPEGSPEPVHIPLTQSFIHTDSIKFMSELQPDSFDHIVTDPDYGVSVERLEASTADAASGVHQTSIHESLGTMQDFLTQAYRTLRTQAFCVFWYDLDHHEKLQTMAIGAGFRVQRWPLIWIKSDYRSNAAPAHNFCKNIEYAMVCRKPNAVLTKTQMSSVFTEASADTVRQFGHPFAKPLNVWKWIFGAIAIKGQIVYDPFLGSGSSAAAAIEFGLRPIGTEISIDHYSSAVVNLQAVYQKMIGGNVRFT